MEDNYQKMLHTKYPYPMISGMKIWNVLKRCTNVSANHCLLQIIRPKIELTLIKDLCQLNVLTDDNTWQSYYHVKYRRMSRMLSNLSEWLLKWNNKELTQIMEILYNHLNYRSEQNTDLFRGLHLFFYLNISLLEGLWYVISLLNEWNMETVFRNL